MKNVVLAIVAALVLIAVPVAAQTDTTTTPSTGLTNTQQPTEVRTNAASPMHSSDPGLTAHGDVVSWNDDEVVIKTSTGLTHIKLLPSTTGNRTFTVGQNVAIDFSRNEQGVLLARQIRAGEPVVSMPSGITTTGAAEAGVAVEKAADNVGEAVTEGVEETTKSDLNNDGAIGTRGAPTGSGTTATSVDTTPASTTTSLPATGSKAPLFGLLGLLALGGAAALRRL